MDEATVSADCIRKVSARVLCVPRLQPRDCDSAVQDIRDLRLKATNITGNQTCEECHLPVLSTSLYVFPCLHAFHSSCLCSHVITRTVDPALRRNMQRLEQATKVMPLFAGAHDVLRIVLQPVFTSTRRRLTGRQLRSWTISLAATARCVVRLGFVDALCSCLLTCRCAGELMLKSLGQPFLTDADANEAQVWQL